jgi:hypothetical protein
MLTGSSDFSRQHYLYAVGDAADVVAVADDEIVAASDDAYSTVYFQLLRMSVSWFVSFRQTFNIVTAMMSMAMMAMMSNFLTISHFIPLDHLILHLRLLMIWLLLLQCLGHNLLFGIWLMILIRYR